MPGKGKDERGVGYVKSNAIAGRRFASWSEMEAHLDAWTREVADARVHGRPSARCLAFEPAEDIDERLDRAVTLIPRCILLLKKVAPFRVAVGNSPRQDRT